MSIIAFIGAGVMSSALTFPAKENGHEVRLIGTPLDKAIIEGGKKDGYHITLKRQLLPDIKYYQFEEIEEALNGIDYAICGVSSFGVEWFHETVFPIYPNHVPLLSVTKGLIDLEDGSIISYPQYWETKLPYGKHISISAIGGPCISYELADQNQSYVAFCGKNNAELRAFKKIFERPYYHISLSNDVIGIECAVALKNGYALGVALAIGLAEIRGEGIQQDYNSQAALFGQSVKEMNTLLAFVKAGNHSIAYGAGDLYVTVFGGRTRRFGTLLGSGLSFEEAKTEMEGLTLECVVIATRMANAVRKSAERGALSLKDFPLLLHIDEILNQSTPVNIPWDAFTEELL